MCRPETRRVMRAIAISVMLGAALAGCSDIYYARRDTVALGGGDAVAANMAEQTIDPWPPYSGDTNIPANGQKMQSAVERYRTNKVTLPVNPTTSDVQNQQLSAAQAATQAASSSSGPASSSSGGPSAPSGNSGQ
jgi:hypothetical protein